MVGRNSAKGIDNLKTDIELPVSIKLIDKNQVISAELCINGYKIIYENLEPKTALNMLMIRDKKGILMEKLLTIVVLVLAVLILNEIGPPGVETEKVVPVFIRPMSSSKDPNFLIILLPSAPVKKI